MDRRAHPVLLIATASRRIGSRAAAATLAIATFGVAVPTFASAVPSGPHPRLFMSAANVTAFGAKAGDSSTAAASLVKACQDTIDTPSDFTTRGGSDGDNWPGSAVRCAFAYEATQNAKYLTQAIKYWKAALGDDQNIGDGMGCVSGVSTSWSTWDGSTPAPAVIRTVTHDTGYPMRWYGPDVALTYDWLYGAPGVDASLLAQTRTCLTAWVDYYTDRGYHNDEPGANYDAGYVIGKTLAAIAIGNDGGADGHLWTETTTKLFPTLLVGQGLAGASGALGTKVGVMVGGDWAEGWQYGPLSVLEYAVAARALEEQGESLPEMDAWTDSIGVRLIHGTVPSLDGQWVGGDFDSDTVYQSLAANQFDAVLAGPSTDQAASWMANEKAQRGVGAGSYFYNALAELRNVTAADYRKQSPAPAPWYLSRGTRAMYVRTSWDTSAFWGVFSSAGAVVSDHEHLSASNFVFTRGADHLIVDPSGYGEYDSLATNAVTADSTVAMGDYKGTQTPWSEAELVWARGTADATYAARSDFASAFAYSSTPSDIPYAHREWVMFPEGEVVAIDRVHTADATHGMYVTFHTNTGGGGLALSGSVASGSVGGSAVAIHAVRLSGGTPKVTTPPVGDCQLSCSYPCGQCDSARFAVDEYRVAVPGPNAVAIHVIDGLAKTDAQAVVDSLNDDTFDPAPKQNDGVLGVAVQRSSKLSYVVASSAVDGASPSTMAYGVPGTSSGRHVVFDAPEDASGKSTVTAKASGDRCVISIAAGAGFTGRPLMFTVGTSADGCTTTEGSDVAAGSPVGTGGHTGVGSAGGDAGSAGADAGVTSSAKSSSGCGCRVGSQHTPGRIGALGGIFGAFLLSRRRQRRRNPAGIFLAIAFLLLAVPRIAHAMQVTIAAGQTYTLSADLALSGADTLDANGTVQSPCIIAGNGHAILANNLTGHVKIANCLFQGLGGTQETTPALELTAQGTADVTITGSTFDACGTIRLHMEDTATATFDDNLLEDTGIAYIQDELVGSMYVPAFYADGSSTGTKVFQGNRMYRDAAYFDGVSDWLIGGYGDTFTNVLIGHRGVIRVRGNHVKVVGNFINPQYPLTSPDVENIVVGSDDANPDLVMEHNVLRSGEWVLRECQGEVRYNLIADMNGHAWIKGPHDCNVHHNVFVNYDTPDPNREAGIDAVYFTPHLNIYNNTFDGGGTVANLGVPAIHAGQGRLIERVSSNAITNFIIPSQYAAVSSTDDETQYDTNPPPGDARMHFADYNLFYNPDAASQVDYSIKVEPDDVTPIAKGSVGFAMHDVHAAPGFKGPLPTAFPFASADVQAGTVKVSSILSHYRDLYTPASGSPLTGAGDPAGGAHNNIGAIGQGSSLDPNDQFGTFMPGTDGGPPPLNLPDSGLAGQGPDGGSGGPDGGTGPADSGAPSVDAGSSHGAGGSSGCGCRFAGAPYHARAGVALLLVVVAARIRRRR